VIVPRPVCFLPMLRPCSTVVIAFLAVLAGCGPPATEGGFDGANSAARMYAIEHAARSGDRTAVRDIVQLLDSDDPAVRWLAIAALERLTGETYGYRHYDSTMQRRDAIARWVQALDSGKIMIQPMNTGPHDGGVASSPH
jgi:hypothetical protein